MADEKRPKSGFRNPGKYRTPEVAEILSLRDGNTPVVLPSVDPELDNYVPEVTEQELKDMTALEPRDIRAARVADKNKGRVDPVAAMRVVAKRFGPVSFKTLAEIMTNPKEPGMARLKAAEIMLQYGYGKPGLWIEPKETQGVQNTMIKVDFGDKQGPQSITVEQVPAPDPFKDLEDNEDDGITEQNE